MNLAFKYNNWRQGPTSCRYAIYCCNPFSITRLDCNRSITSFYTSNHLCSRYNPHLKAYFIKVVYILLFNTILGNNILYQPKPVSNNLWIFAFGSLVVVLTIISSL